MALMVCNNLSNHKQELVELLKIHCEIQESIKCESCGHYKMGICISHWWGPMPLRGTAQQLTKGEGFEEERVAIIPQSKRQAPDLSAPSKVYCFSTPLFPFIATFKQL